METIEIFFKNKITFVLYINHYNTTNYVSKNIYYPKEYTPEFAKEKIKAFFLYLFSSFEFKRPRDMRCWNIIQICFYEAFVPDDSDDLYRGKPVSFITFYNDNLCDINDNNIFF